MKVAELKDILELTHLNGTPDALNREVTGGYCGDLLSWVMSRASSGQAWITIMQNANTAKVAALADVSCVILAEGVTPDADLTKRASTDDLPLFLSSKPAYKLGGMLYECLLNNKK
ncbi:hypothetical protein FACS1894208_01920 [Clostridia bacterium]|nr:hypothetical protein FACS1894208_01920 [Clostridia bacterium]